MLDLFLELAAGFSAKYFACQIFVILALFLLGLVLVSSFDKSEVTKKRIIYNAMTAFPVGLSVFIILAYIMLSVGIIYNTVSVICGLLVIVTAVVYAGVKTGHLRQVFAISNRNLWIIIIAVTLLVAAFSCMGIMPISISNDSMYYFHEYPRDIVYFGQLRDQFDTFLTDTGLGSVAIETLPFLFGFNESFGIREFTHICFIAFMMYRVYLRTEKWYVGLVTGMITAFSSPVYILGHWAMANMYFMEFFFIAAVVMMDAHESSENTNADFSQLVPGAVISVACALLRMEGGIFILLLLGCYTLIRIRERDMILGIALPILILFAIYEIRIYVFYTIDNPYTFLTPQKAVLQMLAYAGVIVYMAFIRKLLPGKIIRRMPLIIILALSGANALLLVYKSELYIANIRAFYGNLNGQSGWGMLPHLALASVIILLAGFLPEVMGRRKAGTFADSESDRYGVSAETYFATLTIGFVLVTIAVSFMRGDALDVSVGDSGNRVLMQAAPLIIYTIVLYFVRLYEKFTIREN